MSSVPHQTNGSPWFSVRGLISACMLCLIAYSGWVLVGKLRPQPAQPWHPTAGLAYRTILQHAGFRFHLASPHGFDVNLGAMALQSSQPTPDASLLYQSHNNPDLTVILDEGVQTHPTLIRADTGSGPALGTVVVNGRRWAKYRNTDPVLATTMPDGVQVVVRSSGTFSDDARFAARVPVRIGS